MSMKGVAFASVRPGRHSHSCGPHGNSSTSISLAVMKWKGGFVLIAPSIGRLYLSGLIL